MKSDTHEIPEKYILLQPPDMAGDDEIDLLKLIKVVWKWKWVSIILITVSAVGAVIYAKSLPEIYKSETVIMSTPSGESNIGGGGLSQILGGFGFNLAASGGGSGAEIIAILESRSFKERLLARYDLLPILFKNSWDLKKKTWKTLEFEKIPTVLDGVSVLGGSYEVSVDPKKGALIFLSWQGKDPEFCSKMLVRVIVELKQYLDHEYITEAKRTRLFVEEQLQKTVHEMKFWEQRVPDEKMTMSEIMLERDVARQVYQQLRGQLESAKIDEAKEMIQFKVLDAPFVPEKRFKPNRMRIVIVAFAASVFFAVFLSFLLEFIVKIKSRQDENNPVNPV